MSTICRYQMCNFDVSPLGVVFDVNGNALKPVTRGQGYKAVSLCGSPKYVHRLVAEAWLDNPDNLCCVNHKDGNKENNAVDNLEWMSYSDNHRHAYDNGLMKRGVQHHNNKLTEQQVKDIRAKYQPRVYSQTRLAEEYGIAQSTVREIINRKIWRHV